MKVQDPSLFVYAFFDRGFPGHVARDPRETLRSVLGELDGRFDLTDADPAAPAARPDDLNLVDVALSPHRYTLWLNRMRVGPGAELRQAAAYTFGDTLYLHALDSRGGTTVSIEEGWRDLTEGLDAALAPLLEAGDGLWGISVVFSALVEDDAYEALDPAAAAASLGGGGVARTRAGLLWRAGAEWTGPGDAWVVVSPRSAEPEVQRLLHELSGPIPPEMALLLQSRHKLAVQLAEYDRADDDLRRAQQRLDRRLDWMITVHRDYEELRRVAGSPEAEELRQKTERAGTSFAGFEQAVSRTGELHQTLLINLRNLRERSARLLQPGEEDPVFEPEILHDERRAEQVAYDLGYHRALVDRARATLDAARSGFAIAQDRHQGQDLRMGMAQVSGLVASLLALFVTEVMGTVGFAARRPVLAANLILLTLVGSFALTQLFVAWRRIRTSVTRLSIAGAAGLAVTTALSFASSVRPAPWYWWAAGPGFAVAFVAAYGWVRFREERPRRDAEPTWRRLRDYTSDIEKLRLASVEVSDLLDDLPPTTVFRLKEGPSLLEKIERKNAARAAELSITPEDLARRGQAYSVRDIGDAIGIRYVTSPWELPVVVSRIVRILGPRVAAVEYKRGRYKTVHIDADLWGVGARRDLNLMAEIQVRTHLQHLYAAKVHDVIYKDVPGAGPWLLRVVKTTAATRWLLPVFDAVLAVPAAVELALFRRWMRWPSRS